MKDLIERLEAATGPDQELDHAIGMAVGFGGDFTSSIDAALTLVPEGYGWNLQGNTNSFYAVVRGYKNKVSPTPAIALCIAALRARETTLKGEER